MSAALLRGPDHTDLGALIARTAGSHAAIALGRGALPKAYPHLDANEDVVAAVAGRDATALVVADAHDGADAAVLVVDTLLGLLGDEPPPHADHAELVDWLTLAGQAAWEHTRAHPYPRRGSRTAIALVLAGPATITWASVGDVAVAAATPDGQELLNPLEAVYLGGPMEREHVAAVLRHGTQPRGPGAWIVVASDGLLDFAPDAPHCAVRELPGAHPALVAERLVQLAYEGGAGDNVAVAVLAPHPAIPQAELRRTI